MRGFAIGVDGGGTRTRAVVVDPQGRELGRGEARGAVVTVAEPEAAANAVWDAVERALRAAALVRPGKVLWAGLSGAGREEARHAVEDALARTRVADRIVVGTDVEAAFHDAFGAGPGVLLIAGTGSIALARTAAGASVRVGGWGQHVGDEGGGYRIGVDALRRILRAEDGREPPTALRAPVLEHLDLSEPGEIVAWVAGAPKADVAALVPFVVRAAAEGDEAASEVLAEAVAELATHLETILERSDPWAEPPELALWGGLIFEEGPLRAALLRAVDASAVRLLDRPLDPPRGAAMKALALMSGRGA